MRTDVTADAREATLEDHRCQENLLATCGVGAAKSDSLIEMSRRLSSLRRAEHPMWCWHHVRAGDFFILGGQMVYIAEMGPVTSTPESPNARLRAIFNNGTESNLLLRSLQNALYKDEAGRRVTEPDAGPLFAAEAHDGELACGTVYVLRSKSELPAIAANRELIHKIGVTSGDVQRRIANAKLDATFLLADVEVVTTYQLYHIDRTKLENLLHRFFAPGRLDITITDRFGNPVAPREWFRVPLFVIDEAIERIRDGSITEYRYDPARASLVRLDAM